MLFRSVLAVNAASLAIDPAPSASDAALLAALDLKIGQPLLLVAGLTVGGTA